MMRSIIWALFGNDDDGIYGDINWNPTQKETWWTAVLWWLRNPFHNFTFYVIGVDGKPFTRIGRFSLDNFAPAPYLFNWCLIRDYYLPFFSYSGALGKFYIGWRERGNFGFKLTNWLLVFALIRVFLYWLNR